MPLWPILLLLSPFVGSFLGVLAKRSEHTALMGRSHCDSCGHVLPWYDLIPILSWVLLRRRCRWCRAPLAWYYIVVELAAIAVVLWAASVATGGRLIVDAVLGWLLLLLGITDWNTQRLPNVLTYSVIVFGLTTASFLDRPSLLDHAVGAALGFGAFLLVALIHHRLRGHAGLGMGDAKLLAGLGAFVTWRGLPSVIFLGALLGLLFVAGRALLGKFPMLRERIPFGPFLALAGWIVWLYGPLLLAA